ncbi:MAG: OmpA family protein [Burkholderiaceae bacterium]|nr:OmpA family protein [Burkholderiaceae bacterium]
MRRSRADEPLPSSDRWLLSWTDFITLLLAVFAAMYAGASVDLAKANAVAQSVGQALGGSQQPLQQAAGAEPVANDHAQIEKELTLALQRLGLGERVRVLRSEQGIGIDIDAELLFGEGDASLSSAAVQVIADIAQLLKDRPYQIRVEGHTDATPITNSRFASNWELSAARAAGVVRMLSGQGIADQRLQAVGLASHQPLVSNQTEQGRARNRRVHLLLLPVR